MTQVPHGLCSESCFKILGYSLHYRGGMKESGIGRENGIEALEACMLPFASSKPRLIVSIQTLKANQQW
jgi:hypothetical protein